MFRYIIKNKTMNKSKYDNSEDFPNRQSKFGDPLLSRAEVAQRLGVCTHTVRSYEEQGLLPVVRLSARTLRYRVNDVETMLKQLRG